MAKKILIVDDEEAVGQLVKLNLEETGGEYQVRVETKGKKALEAAREFQPDLILLDVIMPDAKGTEVAREIKAEESLQKIPIVFLSGAVSKEIREEIEDEELRGLPFVEKPISLQELIDCIEQNLDNPQT